MTITYAASRRLGLLLFIPLLAAGQSLEDKVSQARKLQAQSMLGMDEGSLDSLLKEKQKAGAKGMAATAVEQEMEQRLLDSLLAGPRKEGEEDLEDFSDLDPDLDTTMLKGDTSLAARRKLAARKRKAKAPPKRYEQRIFSKVNRSAFTSARGAVGKDYVLGSGDQVIVSLWGDKEKVYELWLNAEGRIFMEGIGQVPLAGLSLSDAQETLKQKLSKVYSGISRGTAHVDISLGKAGPIRVFVLGEVKLPGGYVLTGHSSVLSALYFAEGPTEIGTVRNLQLTRGGRKVPLDLYRYLIRGESLNPDLLREGDIIFSGRADALVDIQGDVGRPATYELKKGEGVKELLEFAERANPTAAHHKMTLQRIFPGGKVDYMDLDAPEDYMSGKSKLELQDGDKVMVEKSSEISRDFLTITGPVKYPSTYSSEGVSTVGDLVKKAGGLREDAYLGRVHVVRFNPDGSSKLFSHSLDGINPDTIHLEPRDNVILYSIKDMYMPDSVEVAGAVFNPGKFEFRAGMSAKDLIMQAGGYLSEHERNRVVVFRGDARMRKVDQIILNNQGGLGNTMDNFTLQARDLVQVPVDPLWYEKEFVILDGLVTRPGKYALLYPGERIASVIDRAGGFRDNAYVEGGRFFRSRDSVGRVGVDIRKALKSPNGKANIPMSDGDSIYIPPRLNTVKVIGEVGFETSVLYREGAGVEYYIESAGGFTRRSEPNRVVVQYANGSTSRDGYFKRKPDAGSVIYVPQGPEPKPTDWFAGLNAILGTLGVAAAVILSIQAISQ